MTVSERLTWKRERLRGMIGPMSLIGLMGQQMKLIRLTGWIFSGVLFCG